MLSSYFKNKETDSEMLSDLLKIIYSIEIVAADFTYPLPLTTVLCSQPCIKL